MNKYTYHPTGEVCLKTHKATGLTYVSIGNRNISAMAVSIDGFPIAVRGELYCSPEKIVHEPSAFKAGVLRIVTKE